MLALWLFGLGASIANACITTVPIAPAVAVGSHLVAMVEAHPDVLPHESAQSDGAGLASPSGDESAHHGNLSTANCEDFCDKATALIAPLKSALDHNQSHAVIGVTALTVFPMPAFVPAQSRIPHPENVQAPPILIAFLRLAL